MAGYRANLKAVTTILPFFCTGVSPFKKKVKIINYSPPAKPLMTNDKFAPYLRH